MENNQHGTLKGAVQRLREIEPFSHTKFGVSDSVFFDKLLN